MKEMILDRGQRNRFNAYWKSLICNSHKYPVKAELFAELIIMRYPIEDITAALFRAFAPSMPRDIRTFIKESRDAGVVDDVALHYKIYKSYSYGNFLTLWKVLNVLRYRYFNRFEYDSRMLPIQCNVLLVSNKIFLQSIQLEKLLKCLDSNLEFLLQRLQDKSGTTPVRQIDFSDEQTFHSLAAEASIGNRYD